MLEAFAVAQASWGAVGPELLASLPWTEYEEAVAEAARLLKTREKQGVEGE
jgi:hypothetical protein